MTHYVLEKPLRCFFKRQAISVLTVVCVGGLLFLVFYSEMTSEIASRPMYNEVSYIQRFQSVPLALSTSNLGKTHIQRIQHIKDTCAKYRLPSKFYQTSVPLVYSKKDNLAYFDIPKIGSTMLKQMFVVLVQGSDKADNITSELRMNLHKRTKNLKKDISVNVLRNILVIVPCRNPYSRLFSAYVDKVFLPNEIALIKDILNFEKKPGTCGTSVSFASFLSYALRRDSSRKLVDHYGSPYENVKNVMCKLENIILVKQESFSEDVELALQSAGVNKSEFDVISEILHEHRVEATIPGIVKTLYEKSKSLPRDCYPWSLVARILWQSFQIQGFLHNDIAFPDLEFKSSDNITNLYTDADYFIRIILKYIKLRPLTVTESKSQRRNALLNAYENIDKQLIVKIQQQYSMDFEMFQYDLNVSATS